MGKKIEPPSNMNVIVGDTETASLDGGVCDLALAVIDNDLNVVQTYESLIDPERPITPSASGIHGIVDEDVFTSPTLAEWMEANGHPLMVEGLVFGGHNARFDVRQLRDYMPERFDMLCTLKLAKLLLPNNPDHRLQTLRYQFRLEAGPAHRAMGDVITCVSFLRCIAAQKGLDLAGIVKLAQQKLNPHTTKMTFGKHKGDPLAKLPKSYINWVLGNVENLDEDVREVLETLV